MPLTHDWGVDLYRVVVFPLWTSGANKGGLFGVAGAAAYEGVEVIGPVAFEPNFGSPRTFANVSQGQVNDTIVKASIDPKTAVLRTSYDSNTIAAMIANINIITMGEGKVVGEETEKTGREIPVAVMLQTDGHDEDDNPVYVTRLYHKAQLTPSPVTQNDSPLAKEYTLSLSRVGKRGWGEVLTLAAHKHTSEVNSKDITEGVRNVVTWLGDGIVTAFTLPTGKPALTSAKAKVWNYLTGAAEAGAWNVTPLSTTFTPTVTPSADELLVVTYEA